MKKPKRTLLQKAKSANIEHRPARSQVEISEEIDLLLALLHGRVGSSQATEALGLSRTAVYGWSFSTLKRAIQAGLVTVEVVQ